MEVSQKLVLRFIFRGTFFVLRALREFYVNFGSAVLRRIGVGEFGRVHSFTVSGHMTRRFATPASRVFEIFGLVQRIVPPSRPRERVLPLPMALLLSSLRGSPIRIHPGFRCLREPTQSWITSHFTSVGSRRR